MKRFVLIVVVLTAVGLAPAETTKQLKKAQKLLGQLKLADGTGSGLDADTVRGLTPAEITSPGGGLVCSRVSQAQQAVADGTLEVTATCAPGSIATGGGCECRPAPDDPCDNLDDRPNPELDGWTCRALLTSGDGLVAHAVCCVGSHQ